MTAIPSSPKGGPFPPVYPRGDSRLPERVLIGKVREIVTAALPQIPHDERINALTYWNKVSEQLIRKLSPNDDLTGCFSIISNCIKANPLSHTLASPDKMSTEIIVKEFIQTGDIKILENAMKILKKSIEEGFPATPEALQHFDHIKQMIGILPSRELQDEWTCRYNEIVNKGRLKQLAQNHAFLLGDKLEELIVKRIYDETNDGLNLDEPKIFTYDESLTLPIIREFIRQYQEKDLSQISPEAFRRTIVDEVFTLRVTIRLGPLMVSPSEDIEHFKKKINAHKKAIGELLMATRQERDNVSKFVSTLDPKFGKFKNIIVRQADKEREELVKKVLGKVSIKGPVEESYQKVLVEFSVGQKRITRKAIAKVHFLNKYAGAAMPYSQVLGMGKWYGVCFEKCLQWILMAIKDPKKRITSEEEYVEHFRVKKSPGNEPLESADITPKTRYHQAFYRISNRENALAERLHLNFMPPLVEACPIGECLAEFQKKEFQCNHYILSIQGEGGSGHSIALELQPDDKTFVFRDPNLGWYYFSTFDDLLSFIKQALELFYSDYTLAQINGVTLHNKML